MLKFAISLKMKKMQLESGQSALEYIALAVGLVFIIGIAFTVLGGNIQEAAEGVVDDVTGGTEAGRDGAAGGTAPTAPGSS